MRGQVKFKVAVAVVCLMAVGSVAKAQIVPPDYTFSRTVIYRTNATEETDLAIAGPGSYSFSQESHPLDSVAGAVSYGLNPSPFLKASTNVVNGGGGAYFYAEMGLSYSFAVTGADGFVPVNVFSLASLGGPTNYSAPYHNYMLDVSANILGEGVDSSWGTQLATLLCGTTDECYDSETESYTDGLLFGPGFAASDGQKYTITLNYTDGLNLKANTI